MIRLKIIKKAEKTLNTAAEKVVEEMGGDEAVHRALHQKGGNGYLKKGVCPPWLEKYQWKPGQSPNPNGRPLRQRRISTEMERFLAQTEPTTGLTYCELLVFAMIRKAAWGDVAAARFCLEASEGKPKQHLEVSGTINHQAIQDMSVDELNGIIRDYLERVHGGKDEVSDASKR